MNFLISIVILLISTSLFCWFFTSDWGLGPVCHSIFFLVGIVFISLAGLASLHGFSSERSKKKNM